MAGDLAMGVSPALSEFVYRAPTVLSAIAAQPLDKSPTVSTVAPVIPQASTGAVRRLFDTSNDEGPVARAVSTNIVPHQPFRAVVRKRLRSWFRRALEYGLKINVQKSHFLKAQIEYLGYLADKTGVTLSNAHIEKIRSFPEPKNAKQVQQCSRLFSYFRKFVAGNANCSTLVGFIEG